MNAIVHIVERLRAVDAETTEHTPQIQTTQIMSERLARARAEQLECLGGREGLLRLHRLAISSLYAEQREGRSLD